MWPRDPGRCTGRASSADPARPTKDQAQTAIRMLEDELFTEFSFVDDWPARCVSAILTPSSGATAFTSRQCTDQRADGRHRKEQTRRRRLGGRHGRALRRNLKGAEARGNREASIGARLSRASVYYVDNVRAVLEGQFFAQVTERPLLQLRLLGYQRRSPWSPIPLPSTSMATISSSPTT